MPAATREPEPSAHQGKLTTSTPSASVESSLDIGSADETPVKPITTQDSSTQPPSEPTRRSSKDGRSRHRPKATQNTGTNTNIIHTGDSDTYRDRSTHNMEITHCGNTLVTAPEW